MLRDTDAVATLAVKNLGEAAKFYEETPGLVPKTTKSSCSRAATQGLTCIGLAMPARIKQRP